jgi:sRNA-binding protein
MYYRPDRDESEGIIGNLVKHYPQTCFSVPQQRRPLKKTIIDDLVNDGFPVAHEPLAAAIDWYQSHFGYQHALLVGAERIDLRGKGVAKVTEKEAREALTCISLAHERKELKERSNGNEALLTRTGDMPRKTPVSEPKAVDPVARLQSKLEAVRRAMTETTDEDLRNAFGIVGLQALKRETDKVIEELQAGVT